MDIGEMVSVLEGRADEAQIARFSHWMAESEAHRQEFRQVRQLWMLAQGPWPETTDNLPFLKIKARMEKVHHMKKIKHTVVACAGVFAMFIVSWLWWPTPPDRQSKKTLTFYHASLKDVAHQLEETFHTHISIEAPALATCQFTGSFSRASTLNDIMQAIALSLRVDIEDTRNGYEWKGNGC